MNHARLGAAGATALSIAVLASGCGSGSTQGSTRSAAAAGPSTLPAGAVDLTKVTDSNKADACDKLLGHGAALKQLMASDVTRWVGDLSVDSWAAQGTSALGAGYNPDPATLICTITTKGNQYSKATTDDDTRSVLNLQIYAIASPDEAKDTKTVGEQGHVMLKTDGHTAVNVSDDQFGSNSTATTGDAAAMNRYHDATKARDERVAAHALAAVKK